MKIILTAGGGGHFAPLLSLIKHMDKQVSYRIIGRKYAFEGDDTLSFEYRTAKKDDLPFTPITTGRLQRRFTRYTIPSLFKIPRGIYESYQIIKTFQPDVVVSFGGYVSVPVVLAASILKVPVVIHEQTPKSGLANRIASYFATKICISWESSEQYFPGEKVVLTGNPLLSDDAAVSASDVIPEGKEPLLLVIGGSLGSHAINTLVESSLAQLLPSVRLIHQTGDSQTYHDFDRLTQKKASLPDHLKRNYTLVKFLAPHTFLAVLKKSDFVVSRSGINTVFQLLRFEKPSLLIPLPHGQTSEQDENASILKNAGLAEIADEDRITQDVFVDLINRMLQNKNTYTLKDDSYKRVFSRDAAAKLFAVIQDVSKQKKHTE